MEDLGNVEFDYSNALLNNLAGKEFPAMESEAATREQELSRQKTEEIKYDLGFGDMLSTSMRNDSLVVQTFQAAERAIEDGNVAEDPNFKVEEQLTPQVKYDIHPQYIDALKDRAKNKTHFEQLLPEYQRMSAELRYLEAQGFGTKLLMGAAAEITNAPFYIGPMRALPLVANTLGKSFVTRAFASGTAGVAMEALKDVMGEHDKLATDYAAAFVFDGVMGGVLGKRYMKTGADLANESMHRVAGITSSVLKQLKKATTKEEKNQIIQEAYTKAQGKRADATLLDTIRDSADQTNDNVVKKAWSSLRQDLEYVTKRSESDTFSDLSRQLFPDATLQNLDKDAIDFQTQTLILEDQMRALRKSTIETGVFEYANIMNKSGLNKIRPTTDTFQEFSTLLGSIQSRKMLFGETTEEAIMRVMNNKEMTQELNDLLVKSSKSMEDLATNYHKMLGDAGHADFKSGNIPINANYMPISYDKDSLNMLLEKGVDRRDVQEFFAEAVKNVNPELNDEIITLISKKFMDAIQNTHFNRQNTFNSILDDMLSSKQFTDEASAAIRKNRAAIDEARAKSNQRRSDIDYGYTKKVYTKSGKEINLSFNDLISKDYINLMDNYARKMAGTTVLRNYKFKSSKIKASKDTMEKLINEDPKVQDVQKQIDDILEGAKIKPEELQIAELTLNNIVGKLHKNSKVFKELNSLIEEGDVNKTLNFALENFDNILKSAKITSEDLAPIEPLVTKVLGSTDTKTINNLYKALDDAKEAVRGKLDTDYYDAAGNLSIKNAIVKSIKRYEFLKRVEEKILKSGDNKKSFIRAVKEYDTQLAKELQDIRDMMVVEPHRREELIKTYREKVVKLITDIRNERISAQNLEQFVPKRLADKAGQIIDAAKYSEQYFRDLRHQANIKIDQQYEGKVLKKSERDKLVDKEYKALMKANESDLKYINQQIEESFGGMTKEMKLEKKSDFEALETQIQNELMQKVKDGLIDDRTAQKELVRFRTIMKDMLGEPTMKDPDSTRAKWQRIIHAFNIGRLLGQTFWTMTGELGAVATDSGVKGVIQSIPTIRTLIKAYRTGNIDNASIKELQDSMGFLNEFMSGARLNEYNHEYNALMQGKGKGKLDKLEHIGESFAEFTLMTGGVKLGSAMLQIAQLRGTLAKMSKVAKGGSKSTNYSKMINELGLSKDMEELVYEQIIKHSKDDLLHFDKWDLEVKNRLMTGLRRRVDTLVQQQRLGDKPAWVSDLGKNGEDGYMLKDTVFGKLAMELKTFAMTAYTKQLGRAISRADMYVATTIATQLALMSLAYIAKQQYNYAGNEDKLKKAMEPEAIIGGVVGMLPAASVLPLIIDMISGQVTGHQVFGSSRHNSQVTDVISSLASLDLISQALAVATIPANIIKDGFDAKDLNPLFAITGLSNNVLTKPLVEAAREE